jgi:HlyD family secretion protein
MEESMKRVAVVVLLLLVISAAIFIFLRKPEADKKGVIAVSGNIEITDAAQSFKISGRVIERLVTEGDEVKAGQMIAKLDDADLQQERKLRAAEVESAKAELRELEAGSRPEEIRQAAASLASAKAEEERWKKEFDRQQVLHQKEVISQRELEAVRMTYDTAQAKVQQAEEALILRKKGPRIEEVDRGRAQLERAEEALALAEIRLSYATLHSSITGLVLSKSIEAGEYVSAGTPIVTVGKMDEVWLRAYIDETDLGRVRTGQTVRVRTDSFPGKVYQGRISFISSQSEFTPKSVQTEKERVKLVYRIKIDISNPDMELKPGMPADGEIVLANE